MRRVLNIHEVDDARLDEVASPDPGSRDVLVDIKACGICGSDLTYIKIGGIMRQPGGVTPLGHEAAGEIAFGALDLHHARAGIGQTRGSERCGHRLFDGDDSQTFERQHQNDLGMPSTCSAT